MTFYCCFTSELNMSHLILNYNVVKIDLSHHFYIHACKAVTFQILYHLLNTTSLLFFISHHLVFTEHLKMLYLLNLSL